MENVRDESHVVAKSMTNDLPALPSEEGLVLITERLDILPIDRENALAMFETLNDGLLTNILVARPSDSCGFSATV